ncbi:hybrid sensor histidine kinase/response regulator [Noviherbaspirillum pedocola]|uniref:histidine kinase n=1 Tax=Noviherbaspirillum pedocola TaxID=2801341 RepID=A0A934W889_9BURK|nr:PAS domain S-box protein [Noviherbaspirillum pedocola]MBK4736528.1 PAS domain S-box protein [Noviherbaspirillum pedocola]
MNPPLRSPAMRERVLSFDWSQTALGPVSAWPAPLRLAVDIVRDSPLAMLLIWGAEQTLIFNDRFADLAGPRAKEAFGAPAEAVWPELLQASAQAEAPLPGCPGYRLHVTNLGDGAGRLALALPDAAMQTQDGAQSGGDNRTVRRLQQAIISERRAADAARHALADETDFLRGLFEQAPGFTAVLRGPQHVFTMANERFLGLVGQRELIGLPVREALPELLDQDIISLLDGVYAGGQPYVGKEMQMRFRTAPGGRLQSFLLDFVYQPIRDAAGSVAGIFVQGADVTESAAAAERLRIAQEAGGIGSFEWFPDTDELICSDTYRELWGLPEQGLISGAMLVTMVHPDDRNEVGPVKLARDVNPLEYAEYRIKRADNGQQRWLARRGKVIERGNGRRYVGVAFDITERKRIEEALRESEARLQESSEFIRLLLDSTEEGFFSVDLRGKLTLCNRAFLRMLGYAQPTDVLGRDLHAVLRHSRPDGNPDDGLDASIRRAAEAGESLIADDECFYRVDGSSFPVEYRVHPVRRHGALQGALCTFTDIAARRQHLDALRDLNETLEQRVVEEIGRRADAEAALRQAQKMEAIGQLTGGVAHDFNNVLQVIGGNLQLLQSHLAGDTAAQKRLDTAVAAVLRGAKLSSQLLAFARRQPLQPAVINLGRLVQNMDDLLRRALGEAVLVETRIADDLWNTLADPGQIENVILNLAINARDAMEGSGRLTLELSNATLAESRDVAGEIAPGGEYVMLAVADTGCGMSPTVLEKAFEPFFTTKPEGEGTGLGLSMAYGFVRQSGGHIRIWSKVGIGTTIRIYLPRSLQPETAASEVLSGPVVGGNETILVAEDDPDVQATVVDTLTTLGYRVLKADDGESALVILRSGMPIDMLFTDVVMPGPVRSVELARQARMLIPDIAVLFTSGYTQEAIMHGGRLDEGVELLSKPYRRIDLARKIRHIFANRQQVTLARAAQQPTLREAAPEAVASEAAVPALREEPAPTKAAEGALRILVVEDNEDARVLVCELLGALGHAATGVGHAEDALTRLDEGEFDVLFTDVNLPGMSGVELARKAARQRPGIAIIFASGYGASVSNHLELPSRSLAKPYDIGQLKAVLAEVAEEITP